MVISQKRGQASIEYIVLVGVLLVFLIPIVYYSLDQSNFMIKISQLENAVRRVSKVADAVNAFGPGAQDIVTITLPQGVEDVVIANYSISFKVGLLGGISDFDAVTAANVTGSIPLGPGTFRIQLLHLPEGVVNISLKP